jgi:hypothetical protein
MSKSTEVTPVEQPVKKSYHEPLLIRHEPLRNVTGLKSPDKPVGDKFADDVA